MVWKCHTIPCFHFFFCLQLLINKTPWMRKIPVTIMAIISYVLFWKLLIINYVKNSFSTIMRHVNNGIWKTHCSWRLYRHESAYVIILFWVNIVTQTWAKVPWELSIAQKSEPFRRALHQDLSLITAFFFFSQTNLVFTFNLVLIE